MSDSIVIPSIQERHTFPALLLTALFSLDDGIEKHDPPVVDLDRPH